MIHTLLHTCCGPCASACVPALKELGREVTMLFANSNIDTREEFDMRLREAEKLAAVDGVKIAALPYDHEEWLREVAAGYEYEPEKGARCARCFRYNLTKAAEYAKAHGFDSFTTSLTISPHKVSPVIFAAGDDAQFAVTGKRMERGRIEMDVAPRFEPFDFKAHGGFDRSVKRAVALGLYRQGYCGCEFSKARWAIHSKRTTESTNLDAREGKHRDVYTADYQTAGRGRLDHKWLSPEGTNLMMSVVLSVEGLAPEHVSTLPLVAGLAVSKALKNLTHHCSTSTSDFDYLLKWPNDVLVGGKKIAGILCERNGDNVIVGIGVNVRQRVWPNELNGRATSLLQETGKEFKVTQVRNAVLGQLGKWYGIWREKGFAAAYPEIAAVDFLKGREIAVRQTDDDSEPVTGVSNGIMPDGSLDVGGVKVYAGEAHVEKI